MNDMGDIQSQHARLIILRALAKEAGYTLNSSMLADELATFAILRPREWVHAQIDFLAGSEAISFTSAGSVRICVLRQRGLDHVERRVAIEGIKRPSLEA